MCGAVARNAAIVAGGWKNAQIYIIERAKKISSCKQHSEDVV
jgi:hypothetical protein